MVPKLPDKIDASTWEVMHLKATAYIRCFIDMSLYNNVNDKTQTNDLWKKIGSMFETIVFLNRVLVFKKIVRLRYQDGSSIAEHMNAFQGLINQTTSLEVPLADEVLALLLLESLLDSWETHVTLGLAKPEGKHLTLEKVKSSLLNEEARQKDKEVIFSLKALVTKSDAHRGRDKSIMTSKSRGRPTCIYSGKTVHFQKNC